MSTADTRENAIIDWLTHTLNFKITQFKIASSDASFRRYFRVVHNQGWHIIMDAPPEKENISTFIQIATLLKTAGLNVPQIYHQDLAQGFLLLEDFGSHCFFDRLNESSATELYYSAFDSLHQLQSIPISTIDQLPHYNEHLLHDELAIFYNWFLEQYLDRPIPEKIKKDLNQLLISSALEQPRVCVHRDFHSRNLMFLPTNSPGIIDFQDAVIGPITYDLVSLLRDCYIAWPEEKVRQWMVFYFKQLTKRGLINTSLETFSCWFDLMGLQRHLKAIGIFTRLNLRDNKPEYLADIPRTLNYVRQICSKYPELAEFNHFLLKIISPTYNHKK